MRYDLEFRKLTFYQKMETNLWAIDWSGPQDVDFNSNFAKNRDITMVKNSLTTPVTPVMLRISLPADVLWGLFVMHSFLPHGRNEWAGETHRTSAGRLVTDSLFKVARLGFLGRNTSQV